MSSLPDDIRIAPWTPDDRDEVIALILSIQQGEFDLPITMADQPDLVDVDHGYRATGGELFVARDGDGVAGTIAALVVEDNTIAVRKMFVGAQHRGTGLAATLMETIVEWARRAGYRTILLGTTSRMHAAHRFYAKHGFDPIDVAELPSEFPRMPVDDRFYRRDLPGVVSIREYDPRWPQRFAVERDRIAAGFGDVPVTIEHAGSTSVPGLPAKPIIDIVLLVPDSADEAAYFPVLVDLGYRFTLREPEWFEHRLFNRDWPRVNLHVFSTGCAEAERMLRFRDHLRRDAADRGEYERAKRELATREWAIVQDYADAKTDVVADIMSRVG
ncbi:MAG: GNAT family N-acetyltransferase [Actinobacteria bacterium]|nr:GNAT family N-acetyltransferase [Actinomycetota bacterium]